MLTAVAVLVAAASLCCSAHSPAGGCNHNLHAAAQPLMMAPPAPAAARTMHALATPWAALRITMDYGYADAPADDKYPTGKAAACTAAGELIDIGGGAATKFCFDNSSGTEVHQFQGNCRLACKNEDLMDPALLAKLKTVADASAARFQQVLKVQPSSAAGVVVQSPMAGQYCGDMTFGPDTVATDLVVKVTTRPLRHKGATIAFATTCALDDVTRRPVLAHMNVPPATLRSVDELGTVLLHELTHGLGFSPSMFNYLRHPSNNSQSYYEYDPVLYPTGPVKGDGVQAAASGAAGDIAIDVARLGPGKKLYLVTPTVVAEARKFFACNGSGAAGLTGVELENGGNSTASTASHWEKRILYYEYMTATKNHFVPGAVSAFTLAYFTDMGFYQADLAAAEEMRYGRRAGCAWATGPCQAWPKNYFCDAVGGSTCGFNKTFSGECNAKNWLAELPAGYQHFPGEPHKGGEDVYADRCPYAAQFSTDGLGGGSCLDPANMPAAGAPNGRGVRTGFSSRCFMTRTILPPHTVGAFTPSCNTMVCNGGGTALVRVGRAFYPCTESGIFQLGYPPNFVGMKGPSVSGVAETVSYGLTGLFRCGYNVSSQCADPAGNGLYTATAAAWPTLTAVTPNNGSYLGGTSVTVSGTALQFCKHVQVGGIFLTGLTQVDGQVGGTFDLVGTLGAVVAKAGTGGAGEKGTGAVDVELWCNVTEICSDGCNVARLTGAFDIVKPVTTPLSVASAVGAIEAFFRSPVGLVVGAILAVLCFICLLCAMRACMAGEAAGGNEGVARPAQATGPARRAIHDEDLL
jgi:hypothetical protein